MLWLALWCGLSGVCRVRLVCLVRSVRVAVATRGQSVDIWLHYCFQHDMFWLLLFLTLIQCPILIPIVRVPICFPDYHFYSCFGRTQLLRTAFVGAPRRRLLLLRSDLALTSL